jgi:hypothetical protein
MLSLDHVSVRASVAELEHHGFRVTPTAGAEDRHARILLDRGYLELRPPANGGIYATGWFVRSDDQEALRDRLSEAGFATTALMPYPGVDGSWLDLELPGRTPVTPIVTRRVDRDDWPPPLTAPHPNGALHIAGLRATVQQPRALSDFLIAAGGHPRGPDRVGLGGAELEVQPGPVDALTAITFGGVHGRKLVLELAVGEG